MLTNTIEDIVGMLIKEIYTKDRSSISRLDTSYRNGKSENNENFNSSIIKLNLKKASLFSIYFQKFIIKFSATTTLYILMVKLIN